MKKSTSESLAVGCNVRESHEGLCLYSSSYFIGQVRLRCAFFLIYYGSIEMGVLYFRS